MNILKQFHSYEDPIRAELFSSIHLEKHGEILANEHTASSVTIRGVDLAKRILENENILKDTYVIFINSINDKRSITPAVEWLVDNYYLIEEQIQDIREQLPLKYYKQLPKLSAGQLVRYPRVYGIAFDFVSHTDSLFELHSFKEFIKSYQRSKILTIGELWALSITLRIVLIENLRRISVRVAGTMLSRFEADKIADQLLDINAQTSETKNIILKNLENHPLPSAFIAQLIQRLRFQEGTELSVLEWLESKLASKSLSAENVVSNEHHFQTSANTSVRNIITSMRLINAIDWHDFFEDISLVDEVLRSSPTYEKMDFITRDRYRHGLEDLARGSNKTEIEIAKKVIQKTKQVYSHCISNNLPIAEKQIDTGYYLVSTGRYQFEKEIGFKLKLRNRIMRWHVAIGDYFYIGTIALSTILLILICSSRETSLFMYVLAIFPASEIVIAIINRIAITLLGPQHLPRLDLSTGIPTQFKTFIVVPTFLSNETDIERQVEQLEIHYLSNPNGDVYFALLSDWRDSEAEHMANDQLLLETAQTHIDLLNIKYKDKTKNNIRFYIFHRKRIWNQSEKKWIGWERKRGKLTEFNKLLREPLDKNTTSFILSDEAKKTVPQNVKFVITLDADTKLPQNSVAQLVGTFAHPLNHPRFDTKLKRVTEGYGILQPRITPTLPTNIDNTLFQRLTSGPCGIDPYASAVSDIYQDLFKEGSYTGKGIYNIDVLEQALNNQIPENRLLSHDLFEGSFARCGLISDVEFFEDFPSHFEVSISRIHRWARGDWQLLPWIFGRSGKSISMISRFKMVDNLRRTLTPLAIFLMFIITFCIPHNNNTPMIVICILSLGMPQILAIITSFFTFDKRFQVNQQLRSAKDEIIMGGGRFLLNIIFLPFNAWIFSDAISRTLYRLTISKKHLLEWTTSAQSKSNANLSLKSFLGRMISLEILITFLLFIILKTNTTDSIEISILFSLWLISPFMAWHISNPPEKLPHSLTSIDTQKLRLIARKTWMFFSTFVTNEENYIPPDNFQEDPSPIIAHRSSPTNFGLYLLSVISARDFGWIGICEMTERLENTLLALQNLEKHNGHFFNWYCTTDCSPLEPRYISSVDNGNLAGHLLAISQACIEFSKEKSTFENFFTGPVDAILLLKNEFSITEIDELLTTASISYKKIQNKSAHNELLLTQIRNIIVLLTPVKDNHKALKIANVIEQEIASHERDNLCHMPIEISEKLLNLSALCLKIIMDMDFKLLYDKNRKLFSIGLKISDNTLDAGYYDLLASEARLLSFIAIAKGDVPPSHWFRLGRRLVNIEKGTALISWSGSMFEYLMPSLVMHTPLNSLLEQTSKLITKKQISYGREHDAPWGISESAYNVRDLHMTYQYSNFGVPTLGLKRGLEQDFVIAPYATILASMFDSSNALKNLDELSKLGCEGEFGYYDSIDFTKSRLPANKNFSIVKTYMAHHQGMSLVSLTNVLFDDRMKNRFHRNTLVQASELILQEKTPRNIAICRKRTESLIISSANLSNESSTRHYYSSEYSVPRTQVLGNGNYSVMLTTAGSGYSRYQNIALTRWREDVTRDNWGSYIYIRDINSSNIWSAGFQPTCTPPDKYEVIFNEDRVKILRSDKNINSELEIFISPEDHAEIRRLSLSNTSQKTQYLEITSYSEIVLNTQTADVAHPSFSNLFIQTEYINEFTSLLASRRPRSANEKPIWMAHVINTDQHAIGKIEYETNRVQFIGRGRTVNHPISIENGKSLSGTVGSVLDPIAALRTKIKLEPGKTAHITFAFAIAETREEILKLADKYHDNGTYERTSILAWTESQIRLHYLGINHSEASLFQKLANRMVYLDPSLRPTSEILKRNNLNVTRLWAHGISGDNPIILLKINSIEERNIVRQLLMAQEYWKTKTLSVDLIILTEKSYSYSMELFRIIETMVNSNTHIHEAFAHKSDGKVFIFQSEMLQEEEIQLLTTISRVIINSKNGNLSEQIRRLIKKPEKHSKGSGVIKNVMNYPNHSKKLPELEFFNGIGGFIKSGKEYYIKLNNGQTTPAPWVNIIANQNFGFQISESGASSTWANNSRENQITPWSNDPVCDPSGECFYIFDKNTGQSWSPTLNPIRLTHAEYIIRHGQGYSHFELCTFGIASLLTQFVHVHLPVKICKIVLTNKSDIKRELTLTGFFEWVLGFSRSLTIPHMITEYDKISNSIFCTNPWSTEFGSNISFATILGQADSWTTDRAEFLGRNGSHSSPRAIQQELQLSKKSGAGLDACAVLQKEIILNAGEETTIIFLLGQTNDRESARTLIKEIHKESIDSIYANVISHWDKLLEKIQVETPDVSMNLILNRWLLYQNISCRLWSRSAFYQSGGAYGFRDQLQDSMAMIWSVPDMTKNQILRASCRQFTEGDVQHWWHMPSGRGVRTHFSDDLLWLPFVVSYYIKTLNDNSILNIETAFLTAPLLPIEKEDSYDNPQVSTESASIYEHCARSLDHSLRVGVHGLPLMGGGDWNDGMNRVGHEGKGESVWLAWFLVDNLNAFTKIAEARGDRKRAQVWSEHVSNIKIAIEKEAWDGSWYRRAFYDDGSSLGSSENLECRIDSLAQTWSAISGAGEHSRIMDAMNSVEKYLIKKSDKMILLFSPPFDKTTSDPGYIKGYVPGIRENGGQYSHAAIWCVYAYTRLNQGQKAVETFSMLNPINHAKNLSEVLKYKVEPYVIAADIYSQEPHLGRGGWTWYTGSAAWLYRAGIEEILGFQQRGNKIFITPHIDPSWNKFTITYKYFNSIYKFEIKNPKHLSYGISKYWVDDKPIEKNQDGILLVNDGLEHIVVVELL